MTALMTRLNSPSVATRTGSDSNRTIGLIRPFTTPAISARTISPPISPV